MRVANLAGRLVVLDGDGAIDVERASGGRFSADPQAAYGRWSEFTSWASAHLHSHVATAVGYSFGDLRAPVPAPRQVFAIGLNYREHAEESHQPVPDEPLVFTKFPTCLTGPVGDVVLPTGSVDWEVEIVAVVGGGGRDIARSAALDALAGLTIGQDLSERRIQLAGSPPQFSLGKSFQGFGPIGPYVATPDEFPDDLAIELGCRLDGEVVQHSSTTKMIFDIPTLVSRLSAVAELLPGDLIFTGTPSGVGVARDPQRFIGPGSTLVSYATGLGEMTHRFVSSVS